MSLSPPASSPGTSIARRSPSPSSKSDPAAGLEIALAQFGANLTDDERKRLNEQKSGLNDADAAFKFTLELDELDPVRRGRVAASKLCSLLQTVQIFGQVVDTYVSSNPEIAALIWGSLKLTFMVLINFTSYFHKFTDLLHGFDHLIPQFTEYQSLFPDSDGLKTSICQFHLAVVSCCTQIISITRLPWTQKALAALTQSFESRIRPAVDDIRTTAKRVKDAISLAKAQYDRSSQVDQEKTQKSLLKRSLKTAKGISRLEKRDDLSGKAQKWESLLKRMSSYSHETAYKNARSKRHKGTAEWIFDTQEFQRWFLDEQNAASYLAGKIGSGKTILTANIIDYVKRHKTAETSISFFFIRFDDINSQEPDTILRSITRQSLARQSVDNTLLGFLEESERSTFDHETLLDLFVQKLKTMEDCFIVLDGLDECSHKNQSVLLRALAVLLQKSEGCKIKILISARDSVAEQVNRFLSPVSRFVVGSGNTNRDLRCYAQEILREKQEGDWNVGDPRLIDEILESISFGGDGMFLWVFLTIEDICTRRSDDEIRQALRSIPRNLSETFNRVLRRIEQNGNAEIAQNVFKWAVAVRSPLTLNETAEVLLVKPNQSASKASQRINGIRHLPAWCENLVQVEEDTETIHFSHHSIRAFLLDHTEKPSGFSLNWEMCNHYVGEICLTYLHFNDFQRTLTRKIRSLNPEQVPVGVVNQTLVIWGGGHLSEGVSRLIKKPFEKKRSQSPQNSSLEGLLSYTHSGTAQDYPFLPYAKQNWIHHTQDIEESSSTWQMWCNMDLLAEYAPWMDPAWKPPGLSNLEYDTSESEITARRTRFLREHRIEPKNAGRHWFALHRAIAYAEVAGNFALAGKVSTHMSERHMPWDLLLLGELLQTNLAFNLSSSMEASRDGHDRLVGFVAELLRRDDSLHPQVVMGSPFCMNIRYIRYKCGDPGSHGRLGHYVCKGLSQSNERCQCYLSAFRLWSRVSRPEFTENIFTRFQADFETFSKELVKVDGDESPNFFEDGYHIIIGLVGQGPVRILQWLFASSELWTREFLENLTQRMKYALTTQKEDVLRLLLDDRTWPASTWFRNLHYRHRLLELSRWLPRDLEDRLNQVFSLAAADEDILYTALLNRDWNIATEMRGSGTKVVKTYDIDYYALEGISSILDCNFQRREGSCVLKEGKDSSRLCNEHRKCAERAIEWAIGDGKDPEDTPKGTLIETLKCCLA